MDDISVHEIPKGDYYIYTLLEGKTIVYIGITNNIDRRISEHESSPKVFDDHQILLGNLSKAAATHLEKTYIERFNPKYNIMFSKKNYNNIDIDALSYHKILTLSRLSGLSAAQVLKVLVESFEGFQFGSLDKMIYKDSNEKIYSYANSLKEWA